MEGGVEPLESLALQVERASSQAFAFVPLPWRVIFLSGSGILCWATNLHFLHLVGIDAAYILDIHSYARLHPTRHISPTTSTSRSTPSSNSVRLYTAIYKLFGAYSVWSFGCWLFFRALCGGDVNLVDQYKIIPELCGIGLLAALICPFNVFRKRERDLFLHGVYRCLFSPTTQSVYFSDVVLADIFTSFAKVIGDLWISVCMLAPWGSLRVLPIDQGWLQWTVPALMSLPYLARLRQCVVEYLSSPQRSNKRALFNAAKYASSLPVIFLSAAQRLVVSDLVSEKGSQAARSPWHGEHHLFRLWLLAVACNSGYSFWWDVTNDWGLSLLQPYAESSESNSISSPHFPPRQLLPSLAGTASQDDDESLPVPPRSPSSRHHSQQSFPRGLRPTLLFRDPTIYYIAISLNFILRLTWSLKLSSHLHSIADLEVGIFLMEALELIRRWMWVFFRVEWEAVRKGFEVGAEHFVGVSDLDLEAMRRSEDT